MEAEFAQYGMEAQQLHRGRLIDHVHLIARDIEATKRFYVAALAALGRKIEGEGEGYFWSDELFVSDDAMSTTGPRTCISRFRRRPCDGRSLSRRRIAAGGKITASPACVSSITRVITRVCHRSDGNNIEAVYHGPAKRSAESVVVSF